MTVRPVNGRVMGRGAATGGAGQLRVACGWAEYFVSEPNRLVLVPVVYIIFLALLIFARKKLIA